MLRRAALASLASAALAIVAAGPAPAATVELSGDTSDVFAVAPRLSIHDTVGEADDLHIRMSDDGKAVTVTGATARAGAGCRQEPGVVACPTALEPSVYVELGAGDDRLVLDGRIHEQATIWIEGGDGADELQAQGTVSGNAGNDILRVNRSTGLDELYGDEGDDQLFAATGPVTLVGGSGTDALRGGPGNDALVDNEDPGSRDTLACGGGQDLVERNAGDVLRGCRAASADVLSLLKHRWRVWRGGLTEPYLLRLAPIPALGQGSGASYAGSSWSAVCRGAACRGARFTARDVGHGGQAKIRFRLRYGGVLVPGKRIRAVLPGARITVSYRIEVAAFIFTKKLEFTTRKTEIPRKRKVCFMRWQGEADRRVPCA
jgi:hypothetical protein